MKLSMKKNFLSSFALLFVFTVGVQVHSAHAQIAGNASTPEAQSPAKNQQVQDENDAYRKSPSVIKLGSLIGLNADQSATAFEVANFVLLAGALGWVVARMVPKMIRNRNTSIQKHLVDARTATEEARLRLSAVEERLAKLDGEIAQMRSQAEQEAGREEQRMKASVEDERKKILASAEQEIAAATLHAQKQLQQHAADLAIEQAARKLVISAETDRLLVQNFAQRLTGDDAKKGQN